MKRQQYCFNCGESLGVYQTLAGDIEHCGNLECAKAAREAERERYKDAAERARDDDYGAYR